MISYKFGDIVLVEFPLSGSDLKKKRPALVVLDIGDDDVVLAPITTRERVGNGDVCLNDWAGCGLLRLSWVRLAKISCFEKVDASRNLGHLTDLDDVSVRAAWQAIYRI